MEKLIELLNEYNCDVLWLADHREYKDYMWWIRLTSVWAWKIYLYVFSKEYWFIKRLVDNDKINLLQLDNRIALSEFNKVERVLMALSISENPIEDLISYLE